jgi:tetrapyrrole methylase family protein/MazG family protein
MPALLKAHKIQTKAAKVGFDWKEPKPIIDKVKEEIEEFENEFDHSSYENMKYELGDMLFSIVNLARHLNIDPEEALSLTNKKFEKRFRGMEKKIKTDGRDFSKLSLADMDEYWNIEKKNN